MNLLEAVVLGVAQGATEFLPVSSTAHLRIVPAFVGWKDPGAAFTAVVQLGTMLAILVYFRTDIVRILAPGSAASAVAPDRTTRRWAGTSSSARSPSASSASPSAA